MAELDKGVKVMKRRTLGIAIFFILFLVGGIPASASVIKEEYTDVWMEEDTWIPIAPDVTARCDIQNTINSTGWNNTGKEMGIWKTDSTITREGICDDGTRFKCIGQLVGNAQNTPSPGIRTLIYSENCWFHHPDGSTRKMMVKSVYANGKSPVTIYWRWN
jgi:hypothetical protein